MIEKYLEVAIYLIPAWLGVVMIFILIGGAVILWQHAEAQFKGIVTRIPRIDGDDIW